MRASKDRAATTNQQATAAGTKHSCPSVLHAAHLAGESGPQRPHDRRRRRGRAGRARQRYIRAVVLLQIS